MPCDQVNMVDCDLGCVNRNVIEAAVKALGWKIQGQYIYTDRGTFAINAEGIARVREEFASQVNKLRLQCSKEAVKMMAKKCGWNVQKKGDNKLRISKGI